jgi:hypothetical protein
MVGSVRSEGLKVGDRDLFCCQQLSNLDVSKCFLSNFGPVQIRELPSTNFILQQSSDLATPNWSTVTDSVTFNPATLRGAGFISQPIVGVFFGFVLLSLRFQVARAPTSHCLQWGRQG